IDYRSTAGQFDRLPEMVADLAGRNVAVIISIDSDPATRAAMAATQTIPIVFTTAGNPVQLGFVASWNRPGGNVTGITTFGQELLPKRLELVREILPTATKVALLLSPGSMAVSQAEIQAAQAAAYRLGLDIVLVRAGTESEIESALTAAVQEGAAALMVVSDTFLSSRHEYIALLALRHALPTISSDRIAVVAGQLLSYGPNSDELYQLAGTYVGRILKGEKPANLPVMQPTKFELAINLKTARGLGLEISPMVLARVDEVIESPNGARAFTTAKPVWKPSSARARFAASGLGSASRATSSALTDIICRIARSEGCGWCADLAGNGISGR